MTDWLINGGMLVVFFIVTGPVARRIGYWLADRKTDK